MTYSALWFSQLQFFVSLSFMTVFFALSFGLSWVLFYLRLRARGEQHLLWLPVYRFWARIFALSFLLSFASSMPVFIQLGSLWPQLLPKIQAISSPVLAVTLLGALLFKAAFLGLMLFGQRQLAENLHALIVFLVALGNTLVALCLLVLISWMHTPAGAQWVEDGYVVTSWLVLVTNPSMFWYTALFIATSFVLVALLMMAILALQSIRRPLGEGERRAFKLAVYIGSAGWLLLLIAFVGNGFMVAAYQPIKAAAAMGYWQSGTVPVWLIAAWPSSAEMLNYFTLGIQKSGQIWLGVDAQGVLIGLDQVVGMGPPVALVFWSLRIAMLCGLLVFFVLLQGWRVGMLRHYDPSALVLNSRRLLLGAGFLGPLLMLSGLSYHMFGVLPFVVGQTITINEIYSHPPLEQSVLSFFAYLVVYALFLFGFIMLIRHVARYGVVAVARRRGRA